MTRNLPLHELANELGSLAKATQVLWRSLTAASSCPLTLASEETLNGSLLSADRFDRVEKLHLLVPHCDEDRRRQRVGDCLVSITETHSRCSGVVQDWSGA